MVTWNLTPAFFLFLYVNMDVIQHLQCSVIRSGETQKLFLIIRGEKTDPPPSCVWSENVSAIEESQDSLQALKLSSELNILCDLILKNTWTLEQPCLSQAAHCCLIHTTQQCSESYKGAVHCLCSHLWLDAGWRMAFQCDALTAFNLTAASKACTDGASA